MKQTLTLVAALLVTATSLSGKQSTERKQLFDFDWQFSQDSISWRAVDLPHDWSIEGAFDREAPAGNDDINDNGSYTDHTLHAWKGRALLVVKSIRKQGAVTVTVRSKGLEQGRIRL